MASRLDLLEQGKLNAQGHEVPDPNPVAIPAGMRRPRSLDERMKELIRTTLSEQARRDGNETFEEAEDFDIGEEDFDHSSPYEEIFDPTLGRGITLEEFKKHEEVYRKRYLEAEERAYNEFDRSNALRARRRIDPSQDPTSPLAEQSGAKRAQKKPGKDEE